LNKKRSFAPRRHTISQVFIFVLLGVFAVMSTFMVLLSAQLYRGIVNQSERSSERRILTSYVANAVRGSDCADAVYTDQRAGVNMLVLSRDVDGETYETLIYCHDGKLCELFTAADQEFEPGYGEEICSAQAFEARISGGLLQIAMTDGAGSDAAIEIALRCSQEAGHE